MKKLLFIMLFFFGGGLLGMRFWAKASWDDSFLISGMVSMILMYCFATGINKGEK